MTRGWKKRSRFPDQMREAKTVKLLIILLLQACGMDVLGISNALVGSRNFSLSRPVLARFFTAFGGRF